MAWQSVGFLTDAAHTESWCDALLEAGALSASVEDAEAGTPAETPQFGEPGSPALPGWRRSRVQALFDPACDDITAIVDRAASALGLPAPAFTLDILPEQNWVQLTQSQFDPIQISTRLWIVPSWHTPPDPKAINLMLDPGMAFGTGSHATTRLCLEWLERTVTPGCSVLDYGCGSGILAIAAARLGAARVEGSDIDPQAVAAARANAQENQVHIRFEDSSASLCGEYDLVVANILANPLRLLAPALCARLRPGGKLALSGILATQAVEIAACYRDWLPLQVVGEQDTWVCLSGEKP